MRGKRSAHIRTLMRRTDYIGMRIAEMQASQAPTQAVEIYQEELEALLWALRQLVKKGHWDGWVEKPHEVIAKAAAMRNTSNDIVFATAPGDMRPRLVKKGQMR